MHSNDLIASVRRRAQIPDADDNYTDLEILRMGDEELASWLMPKIIQEREDHSIDRRDLAISATRTAYRIPALSVNIRTVTNITTDGKEHPMSRLTIEQATDECSLGYYIEGSYIRLSPSAAEWTGKLRVKFVRRLSRMVMQSSGVIAGTSGTNIIFGTGSPSLPSSYEVLSTRSPFPVVTRALETVVQVVNNITVRENDMDQIPALNSSPDITLVVPGDVFMTTGTTIYPQVPEDVHPILAQRIANKVLEAKGSSEDLRNGERDLEKLLDTAGLRVLISPRDQGGAKKIRNGRLFGGSGRNWGM